MRIFNRKLNLILSSDALPCRSVWSQARGLMFRMQQDLVFIIRRPRRVSLHMWFVFYPIDVIFADQDMRVVEKVENFRPFTFYNPRKSASYVIELKAGRAQGTELGDILDIL